MFCLKYHSNILNRDKSTDSNNSKLYFFSENCQNSKYYSKMGDTTLSVVTYRITTFSKKRYVTLSIGDTQHK
jgi:hypothetical protein